MSTVPFHPLSSALDRRQMLTRFGLAGLGAAVAGYSSGNPAQATGAAVSGSGPGPVRVLQPGVGPRRGKYIEALPQNVLWGRLPNQRSEPIAVVDSGAVVSVDAISHEGIMEDQGKDPLAYFVDHGVAEGDVLSDAIAVTHETPHDGPGPHVTTGPIAVRGAEVGDVLKIEVLDISLRVPYGVITNREGKGVLPGVYPESFRGVPDLAPYLNQGGNVSVFTEVSDENGLHGVLPGAVNVRFPLSPFMGLMGVARDTNAVVDTVPPTDTGGNLDITDLGVGSTLYVPVRVPGALFYTGDPHMAQGDGEVALTAMEGSLRPTFRLSVIKKGQPGAPKVAFDYPFAESSDFWFPIGLSDPDGPEGGGNEQSLDAAMSTAVRNAIDFLVTDRGMAGPVAYAYLSAATDFVVSQAVDRTKGVHGRINKDHFS